MPGAEKVISRPLLYQAWEQAIANHQTIYIGLQFGWGKTCTVRDWLQHKQHLHRWISSYQQDFDSQLQSSREPLVVIDNLQELSTEQLEQLSVQISSRRRQNFVLLSRAPLPGCFKQLLITNSIVCFGNEWFRFTLQECSSLLLAYHISPTDALVKHMMQVTRGYPVAAVLMVQRLLRGEEISREETIIDLFHCYDTILFNQYDHNTRVLLLSMALFEEFTPVMTIMVTGNPEAERILFQLVNTTSIFVYSDKVYRIIPLFREYLIWKQSQMCSEAFRARNYHNAGLFYELEGDLPQALFCYTQSGEKEKISELLTRNSEFHPGKGRFFETEAYYRALPRETVLSSPQLISYMSMLCSLCGQIEDSEAWFDELQNFLDCHPRESEEFRTAQERLAYLRISLPHRGSRKIAGILKDVAVLMRQNGLKLPEFSVTSNLPSVMNGGKDFCEWSKHCRQLYNLLRHPVELVLGKSGMGLPEISLGEALFEQGKAITESMSLINSGLAKASAKGTLETEFAATGILIRMLASQGGLSAAISLLESFQGKAAAMGKNLLPNMEALRIRLAMLENDTVRVTEWCKRSAPPDTGSVRILERYRYMTKVRCYILTQKYPDASLLINLLIPYFQQFERTYYLMECSVLKCIILYRTGNSGWRTEMENLLARAQEYSFIRVIADEGAAVLEMVQKCAPKNRWGKALLDATKAQAMLYPDYLR